MLTHEKAMYMKPYKDKHKQNNAPNSLVMVNGEEYPGVVTCSIEEITASF
jgi:hypothetical protein